MAFNLYRQSGHFKSGWIAGFYDAKFDDGLRYLDDILRHGIRSDVDRDFLAGYREGRRSRLGGGGGSDELSFTAAA